MGITSRCVQTPNDKVMQSGLKSGLGARSRVSRVLQENRFPKMARGNSSKDRQALLRGADKE